MILVGTGLTAMAFIGFGMMKGSLITLLLLLVPVRGRLHLLGSDRTPGDRVAMVPAESRESDGACVSRRRCVWGHLGQSWLLSRLPKRWDFKTR